MRKEGELLFVSVCGGWQAEEYWLSCDMKCLDFRMAGANVIKCAHQGRNCPVGPSCGETDHSEWRLLLLASTILAALAPALCSASLSQIQRRLTKIEPHRCFETAEMKSSDDESSRSYEKYGAMMSSHGRCSPLLPAVPLKRSRLQSKANPSTTSPLVLDVDVIFADLSPRSTYHGSGYHNELKLDSGG